MKLEQALSNLNVELNNEKWKKIEVENIRSNPALVNKGDIFVCLKKGQEGRELFNQLRVKPAFVISEEHFCNEWELVVKDARKAYALVAKALNENVCDKMKLIAVTGTNGKTTSTKIIADLLKCSGQKVGTIGTIGACFDNKIIDTGFTTPDPEVLHGLLQLMYNKGIRTVVMEASAHALELKKLEGMKFYTSMLTNVTQDHLDFFGNMENYYKAKEKLFDKDKTKVGVVCNADEFTKRLFESAEIPMISYGFQGDEDINGAELDLNETKLKFKCKTPCETLDIESKLLGKYNAENLLGSICVAKLCGMTGKQIEKFVKTIEPAEGRFNVIRENGVNIVVDFAHTPDGLEKVLGLAKEITKGKLFCLFGCGGNRDKLKRPIMGRIAEKYADKIFLTSDNPRFENPREIIAEIETGISHADYEVFVKREDAILNALRCCNEGDTLVVAGKGGEKYQDIGGIKFPYDDFKVIESCLQINKKESKKERVKDAN